MRWVWGCVAAGLVGAVVVGLLATGGDTGAVQVRAAGPVAVAANERTLAAWPGLGGDPARDERVYAVEYVGRERLIQACMREHGFDYRTIPLTATSPGRLPVDPNAAVVERLSPDRLVAHDMALAGVPDANDPGLSLDLEHGGGCIGEAHRALPGIFRLPTGLADAVAQTRAAAADSPEVTEALGAWRACVEAAAPALRAVDGLTDPGDLRRLADLGVLAGADVQAATEGDRECRPALDQVTTAAIADAEEAFVLRHADELRAHRAELLADHRQLDLSVVGLT